MNTAQSVFATLFLIFWLAFAYKPWLRPKEYIEKQQARRSVSKRKWHYSPQSITFSIFKSYPNLDLWSARLISLLGILICIVILLSPAF